MARSLMATAFLASVGRVRPRMGVSSRAARRNLLAMMGWFGLGRRVVEVFFGCCDDSQDEMKAELETDVPFEAPWGMSLYNNDNAKERCPHLEPSLRLRMQ